MRRLKGHSSLVYVQMIVLFEPHWSCLHNVFTRLFLQVLSGHFLSDKQTDVYVEVDMYGLPADTTKKKFRTKTALSNGINPRFDKDTFVFKKVNCLSMDFQRENQCKSLLAMFFKFAVLNISDSFRLDWRVFYTYPVVGKPLASASTNFYFSVTYLIILPICELRLNFLY